MNNYLIQEAGTEKKPKYLCGVDENGKPKWAGKLDHSTFRMASIAAALDVMQRVCGWDSKHSAVKEPKPAKKVNPAPKK